MGNYMDKYGVIIRYVIAWVTGHLALKYGWDAAQTGQFNDAIYGAISALGAVGVLAYALFKRPSGPAMKVAKEADKVLSGEKTSAVVLTPPGTPNVVITPQSGRGG